MTGKDLFQAMTQVEDELVTEAEEKEWDGRKKKAARPKKYWVTAAACLCVFAVSMAAVTVYQRQGSDTSSDAKNAASAEFALDAQSESGAGEQETAEAPMEKSVLTDQEDSYSGYAEAEMEKQAASLMQSDGTTLETRISVPEGYTRVEEENGSLGAFLRSYPLCPDGSEVLLYDGTPKSNQNAHVAVFDMPVISTSDLQQCADSVMRMYAEYFRAAGKPERIKFHFVDGFLCDYVSYRDGKRVRFDGDKAYWSNEASYDDSDETFENYLKVVFAYSSTLSMKGESESANLSEVKAGDVFLKSGSPGHVMMVVDVCENSEGKRAFLLAQGYMPAQQFHVVKNPLHEEDPWYYVDEISYPFHTPSYTFEEGTFRSMNY